MGNVCPFCPRVKRTTGTERRATGTIHQYYPLKNTLLSSFKALKRNSFRGPWLEMLKIMKNSPTGQNFSTKFYMEIVHYYKEALVKFQTKSFLSFGDIVAFLQRPQTPN